MVTPVIPATQETERPEDHELEASPSKVNKTPRPYFKTKYKKERWE
jgi:hypothetical protein